MLYSRSGLPRYLLFVLLPNRDNHITHPNHHSPPTIFTPSFSFPHRTRRKRTMHPKENLTPLPLLPPRFRQRHKRLLPPLRRPLINANHLASTARTEDVELGYRFIIDIIIQHWLRSSMSTLHPEPTPMVFIVRKFGPGTRLREDNIGAEDGRWGWGFRD
ncbi:MAG: hypothetical protein Q9188_000587 [Gyalolechia gomerana]